MDKREVIVLGLWILMCLGLIVLTVTGHLVTTPNP